MNGVGGGGAFHASACLSHLYVGCMKRGASSSAVVAAAAAEAGSTALGGGGLTGDGSWERGVRARGSEAPAREYPSRRAVRRGEEGGYRHQGSQEVRRGEGGYRNGTIAPTEQLCGPRAWAAARHVLAYRV